MILQTLLYPVSYTHLDVYKRQHPILVDKYLMGKEIEVDAICDGTDILIPDVYKRQHCGTACLRAQFKGHHNS